MSTFPMSRHSAVTRHPPDACVAQQLTEATPWNRKPRFLIRDNDKKFGKQFSAVARSSGIKEFLLACLTPVYLPSLPFSARNPGFSRCPPKSASEIGHQLSIDAAQGQGQYPVFSTDE